MIFTHPLLLLGLLPIAVVALWLMRRSQVEASVPFVHLWPTDQSPAGARWRVNRLPGWMILLLLASVMAVVASAVPWWGASWQRRAQLIVDRGVTMSARHAGGLPAFAAAEESLRRDNSLQLHFTRTTYVPLQDGDSGTPLRATSLDTRQLLRSTIAAHRATSADPILVITDQTIDPPEGVTVVHPPASDGNAGIVLLAVSTVPRPAAMVVVRSSKSQSCNVSVATEHFELTETVALTSGALQTLHFDLPTAGEIVQATVAAADNCIAADDHAWVVARGAWPTLEVSPTAPSAVARLARVYNELRVPSQSSSVVRLTTSLDDLATAPGVVINTAGMPMKDEDRAGVEMMDDFAPPVSWEPLLRGADVGSAPDESWTVLARSTGRTLVAERRLPAHAVLVNFWSNTIETRSDFVVLFASVIDRVAARLPVYSSETVSRQPTWQTVRRGAADVDPPPGVYRDESGQLRAMNVAYVETTDVRDENAVEAALRQFPRTPAGGTRLDGVIALVSITLLGAGAWVAGRRGALAR